MGNAETIQTEDQNDDGETIQAIDQNADRSRPSMLESKLEDGASSNDAEGRQRMQNVEGTNTSVLVDNEVSETTVKEISEDCSTLEEPAKETMLSASEEKGQDEEAIYSNAPVGEDEEIESKKDTSEDCLTAPRQVAEEAMLSEIEDKVQDPKKRAEFSLQNLGLEKENRSTSEISQALSKSTPSLQPVDPDIALFEENLIKLINDQGGRLQASMWVDAYRDKYGKKAFTRHMAATGCEKLKDLLPRLKNLVRGVGPNDSDYLFDRRKTEQRTSGITDSGIGSLVDLENKLIVVIQSRKGNSTMKKLRSGFSDSHGPKALERALKKCGFQNLELAMKQMTRISPIRKNNKVEYTIASPRKPIALPRSSSSAQPEHSRNEQNTNIQAALPLDQCQGATSFLLIDSKEKLQHWDEHFFQKYMGNHMEHKNSTKANAVALSCRGGIDSLHLIALAFSDTDVFLLDCIKLGASPICKRLRPLFESPDITKLIHDMRRDIWGLHNFGFLENFHGMMDTQLIVEYMHAAFHCDFYAMLEFLQLAVPMSMRAKQNIAPRAESFSKRPLSSDMLLSVVDSLSVLLRSFAKIRGNFDGATWEALGNASDIRAASSATAVTESSLRIAFDVSRGYRMASYEMLRAMRPENMMSEHPLEVVQDTSTLLDILPLDVQEALSKLDTTHLADIVFDKGRRPHAWISGKREMLLPPDRLVEAKEIEGIAEQFRFGSDNRAGLERQLHRISAIRNRESAVIGMTVRVGRHVSGNAGIIADLLFDRAGSSILFLGEPGSGKTTIVREVTRILAEQTNVCIVDTSNEIAGDGDVPHPCVGLARRLMVPTLDKQSAVMVEAVQNHTPAVMVIDEIGRKTEVEAAQTCKNRGVRLIASAHGDLRKLVKNPKIRGVVGGIESVTLGDAEAKREGKKFGEELSKVKAQRAAAPIFEIVIELERGSYDSWRVVLDSGKAVDSILERQHYETQRRTREPDTGAIHLSFEDA